VRKADPVELRRRIGYVFQSGALFPHLSVAGNIGITPKLLGTPQAEIADRVDELLELVRLDRAQHRDRLPQELSGGAAPAGRRGRGRWRSPPESC